MVGKEGLLIVFEGIDGAGTSTQVHKLAEHIDKLDKYQDVVKTHEPWRSKEIKKKLKEDKEIYLDARESAELYIEDRAKHTHQLIRPNLKAGAIVETDRYKMSTPAYQWPQGMPLEELIEMHKSRGILVPDLTIFIDVPKEVAKKRLQKRGNKPEKFERDLNFLEKVISAYKCLVYMAQVDQSFFGLVVAINGNQPIKKVSEDIFKVFDPLYKEWGNGKYIAQVSRENHRQAKI